MPLTAANVTNNMIRRSTYSDSSNALGTLESIEFTRSVLVEGLAAAGVTPSQAVPAAIQFVQTLYPRGQPDPDVPLALARGYGTEEAESDDAIYATISYRYFAYAWDPAQWHVESSGDGEQQATDVQYDPTDTTQTKLIPIKVDNYIRGWKSFQTSSGSACFDAVGNGSSGSYNPPPQIFDGGNDNGEGFTDGSGDDPGDGTSTTIQEPAQCPDFGTVDVFKPFKTVTYIRQIYSETAAVTWDNNSTNYLCRLNSVTFTGLTTGSAAQNLSWAPGTVLCRSAGVSYDPFENQCIARVTIWYRPEGWQPWARYNDPIISDVPANIWRAGTLSDGTAYAANGTIRTTAYPTADLNVILSSLTGSNPSPFPTGALP